MFSYIEKVLSKQTFQFQIQSEDQFLSFREVIQLWKESEAFRVFYNELLKEVPFPGFFWENKALTLDNLDQVYEFVIVGTNVFQGKIAQRSPFNQHFKTDSIVNFPNLGHTAQLIVPCPILGDDNDEVYTHLATFVRNAPPKQISNFWQCVGLEFEKSLNEKPIWLSTSGLGVYWLHARLDQVPKYYSHHPYRFFNS